MKNSRKFNMQCQQNDKQEPEQSSLQPVVAEGELESTNNAIDALFFSKEFEELVGTSFWLFDGNGSNGNHNVKKNPVHITPTNNTIKSFRNSIKDSRKQKYQCSYCLKVFPTPYRYQRHILVHTGEILFECKWCGRGFNQKPNLERHCRVHSGKKSYYSYKCRTEFPFELAEADLRKEKEYRRFVCDFCQKKFISEQYLMEHRCSHTGEDEINVAPGNATTKPSKDYFKDSKKRKYRCFFCEKIFSSRSKHQRHILVHTGEAPFECTSCGRRFKQKIHLERHRRLHSQIKVYICGECGREFPLKCALAVHLRTENKHFVCDFCQKKFPSKRQLMDHRRSHRRERPYKCSICEKDYVYKRGLQKHKKKHH